MTVPFNEQYNDPRWKEKRTEIYRRDCYHCRKCGINNTKLEAHHLYYDRNLMLWEYDNDALVTLCTKCHIDIHNDLKKLAGIIAFKILIGEIDIVEIFPLVNYMALLDNR